ncbi:CAAX prenyl protease-like protein [Altererythrobacter ishigakiensis]|uniref:CAAX prenyl protease-like protein n=2 Tax=Altererythrobacter ishigakiensis TaxID=476157 RepID=A0A562UW60_9SPHN|nr:CAAX prenyl protease-like protein [Altererythrobacter ishigakiensis]
MLCAWLAALLPLFFVTDLAEMLWLGFTFLALVFIKASRQATFQWVYKSVPVSIAIGLAVGVVVFAIDFPLTPVLEEATGTKLNATQLEGLDQEFGVYVEWMLKGILLGGILEEILFRGFLIGWGAQLLGKRWAWVLVVLIAVLFGFGHVNQGVVGQILTGIAGLFFGLTYVACGCKLLPAMIAHGTANALTVSKIYFFGYGMSIETSRTLLGTWGYPFPLM